MFTYHSIDFLNEVNVFGKQVTRDTLKSNRYLIELAIKYLGTRVSVPTCQTHLEALYRYMEIPCPSNLSYVEHKLSMFYYLNHHERLAQSHDVVPKHIWVSGINR